jgi:anti-sigma regulatory factor (Ser/Thr protein kinase)
MCRAASTMLEPDRQASGRARVFVQTALDRWGIIDSKDSAVLLTSELVTNAAVHARTGIGLSVAVAEATVEVAVADRVSRLPRPRYQAGRQLPTARPPWLEERGRGLMIVEALADEWGIAEERAGKRVWFRLALEEEWTRTTSCPCHGADPKDVVTLPSGRRVLHVAGPWDS